MNFGNEMKDFVNAFGTMTKILGTPESREAERLDNEYRRATIDWTRARTAEIGADAADFSDFGTNYTFNTTPTESADGGGDGGPSWGGDAGFATAVTTAGRSTFDRDIKPPPRPRLTAAVSDVDLSGGGASGGGVGGKRRDRLVTASRDLPSSKLRTLDPQMQQGLAQMHAVASQMGVRLVLTAGTEGGHLSHKWGRDADVVGFVGERKWTPYERARILGSVAWPRIGVYPNGGAHVGIPVPGHTSAAMWGAGGRTSGASSRAYRNPADAALYKAWSTGRIGGGGGTDTMLGGIAGDGFAGQHAKGGIAAWAAYIERAAAERGIDPSIALRVARSEGLQPGTWQSNVRNRKGERETSYGPFQLMTGGGLGDAFAKLYGDPSDPGTVYRQIDFALDHAAKNGWGAWYGAAKVNVDKWDGLKGARAIGVTGPDYTGGVGSGGSDRLAGGTGDDTLIAPYPEARTKDDELAQPPAPEARTKDDQLVSGMPVGTRRDTIYKVQKGDNLWNLAKRYNLDTYMQIVEANPDITNPDLIYPDQELKIPGGLENVDIPLPRQRPAVEAEGTPDPNEFGTPDLPEGAIFTHPETGERFVFRGGQFVPEDFATAGATVPGGARPEGPAGALPAARPGGARPEGPAAGMPQRDPQVELNRALARRDEYANSDMDPMAKAVRIRAVNVKIAQLEEELAVGGARPEGPAGGLPREELDIVPPSRPAVEVDIPLPTPRPDREGDRESNIRRATVNEFARSRTESQRARGTLTNVPGPQSAIGEELGLGPTEEIISGTDMTAVTGATGDDDLIGQGRGDKALAAFDYASSGGWDLDSDGRVVMPNGNKSPKSTFERGREAARNGAEWISETFFPGSDPAVDTGEDDGTDDANAQRVVSGYGAMKKSQVAQAEGFVRAWADREGIEITNSELHMRAMGMVFDYWMLRGEPEKARALAASYLQYSRVRYNQYSAIAKAALANGDDSMAVKAAIRAYAEIPDGRDITVDGSAEEGWTVTYINEESGKRISKKVLTPDEMTGMIMSMSPDDVEKFLVKAAGEDSMPDMSPQLERMLADLQDTPPGVRPVYDAAGTTQLTPAQQTIYNNAHTEALRVYEASGGDEKAKRTSDVAKANAAAGIGGAVPAAPAAPAATTGTPAATGTPAVTGTTTAPAVTGTPAATGAVPVDETAPAPATVTTDSKDPVDGFPVGKEVAPGVYEPGEDLTFGLGQPPRRNLPLYADMDTEFGFKYTDKIFEQQVEDYDRARKMRDAKYQHWRVNPPRAAVEEKPEGFGAPQGLQGGWLGDEGNLVRAQKTYPYLERAIAPLLPPGPNDNNYGKGSTPRQDPRLRVGLDTNNAAIMKDVETQEQEIHKEEVATAQKEYETALAAITPTPRKPDKNLEGIAGDVDTFIENSKDALKEDEFKHLDNNKVLVADAAREIAIANGLSNDSAIQKVANMITVNPQMPELPFWRAYPHPSDPTGIMLVQPMGPNGPDGAMLLIPTRMFDPLSRAWEQASDVVVQTNAASYEARKTAGTLPVNPEAAAAEETGFIGKVGGAISGAVEDIDLPGRFGAGSEKGRPLSEVPGDLADWLERLVTGGGPGVPLKPGDVDPNARVPR